jgi:hypothetical protein
MKRCVEFPEMGGGDIPKEVLAIVIYYNTKICNASFASN